MLCPKWHITDGALPMHRDLSWSCTGIFPGNSLHTPRVKLLLSSPFYRSKNWGIGNISKVNWLVSSGEAQILSPGAESAHSPLQPQYLSLCGDHRYFRQLLTVLVNTQVVGEPHEQQWKVGATPCHSELIFSKFHCLLTIGGQCLTTFSPVYQ